MRSLFPKLCYILAFLVLGALGNYLHQTSDSLIFFWPLTGIAWFGLVYFGFEFWPWLLGSALLLFFGLEHKLSALYLGMAFSMLAEAFVGAWLFRRFSVGDKQLVRLRTMIVFLTLVVTVSAGLGAILNTFIIWAWDRGSVSSFGALLQSAWIGHGMGALLVGSLFSVWSGGFSMRMRRSLLLEIMPVSLLALLVTVCAFTPLMSRFAFHEFLKPYLIFPLIVWTAIRFTQKGAVAINTLIAGFALYGMVVRYHIFQTVRPNEDIFVMQIYLCVVLVTSLMLAAAVHEAQESLELRKEFFMIASHELKTPLTSLMLQLNLAQRYLTSDSSNQSMSWESARRYIEMSNRQGRRLSRIVEQLFDVNRLEQRNLVLHRETVNLDDLVFEVTERLAKDFDAAGTRLALQLGSKAVGDWDRFRIEQVIENLLSNGLKYAPGQPILVRTEMNQNFARVCVQDQGPGIKESLHSQIFDRFVRANTDPHLRNKPGLGLGLFITKKIIEAHRGSIRVESKPGKGTTFLVDLPTQASETP